MLYRNEYLGKVRDMDRDRVRIMVGVTVRVVSVKLGYLVPHFNANCRAKDLYPAQPQPQTLP